MPNKPINEMNLADQVCALLSSRQIVKSVGLILLCVLTAGLETTGIASVAPFLSALASTENFDGSGYLERAHSILGIESRQELLLVLGLFSFAALASATACRALTLWGQIRFNRSVEYSLACRLMTDYVRRPYAFFLGRNNADLTKMVLTEVGHVVSGFLSPIMNVAFSAITAGFMVALLCFIDPALALGTTAVIGSIYAAVFLAMRRWMTRLGHARYEANQQRFEAVSEVFGGIKEIKLLANEELYLKRFSGAFSRMARAQANAGLAGAMPVYALELVIYGGGLLIALYFLQSSKGMAQVLPLIAVYLLSARRVIPAVQNLFKSATTLRYSQPAVKLLLNDFQPTGSSETDIVPVRTPLRFERAISLNDVSFGYANAVKLAVSKINIEISKGSRVGFVGMTGSGKTTTIDLMLGLLTATTGCLSVDGVPIDSLNIRAWQLNLGYVPQHIYLADDTVMANIAMGTPHKNIDRKAVERAARLACIHDFIIEEMAQGYMTMVGERGIRLSGGQRQRIGIARALYRDPKVLVFDEATSALDNQTERNVMEGLRSLGREKTMIFVAHRLSTVSECDAIYLFSSGKVQTYGSYRELTATSAEFQSLAAYRNY